MIDHSIAFNINVVIRQGDIYAISPSDFESE